MTLVPNHRQPLSGNSLFLVGSLIFILLASSCSLFKPKEPLDPDFGQNKDPKETETEDPVNNPTVGVDTVSWTDAPDDTPHPSFTETEIPEVDLGLPKEKELKDQYEIAVLLPFFTNRFSDFGEKLPKDSRLALEFYEGLRLALDQLELEGVNFVVNALDTQADSVRVKQLLETPEVYNADLIIGPITPDNLTVVESFAKANRIPLVSPLNPRDNIASDNPFFIQVNPSIRNHFVELVKFINSTHGSLDNVLIISPTGSAGEQRVSYIEEGHQEVTEQAEIAPFENLPFKLEEGAELQLAGYLSSLDTTVVIIPSRDEGFVQYVLRELSLLRNQKRFVVYGMEQWQEFQRIDFNYFENLNVRITSSYHVDYKNESALAFKRLFFSDYGMVPVDYSSRGYDIMMYFGRSIHDFGIYFPAFLDEIDYPVIHTDLKFEAVYPDFEVSTETVLPIQFFENRHINILRFQDFGFQRIY